MITTALRKGAIPRKAEIKTLPPPVKGLNDRDPLIGMGPEDALRLENFIPRPYGLVMRPGYSEFATNLGTGPVDTLMSYFPAAVAAAAVQPGDAFNALTIDPTQQINTRLIPIPGGSKIFAACDGDVYDITSGGTGPWTADPVITGTYFSFQNFTNEGGSFLLACSTEGGYYIYNGTAWTKVVAGTNPGEIDGVDPDKFVYVMVWKNRLWFIEKDTGQAWYLPTNQITGKVALWNFGSQFRRGGHLQVLANWTLDAGLGIDDHLVAFGSEGDIVVYTGYDPDLAPEQFNLKGVWFTGPLPNSHRCIDTYGGDLLILSQRGVSRMSDIVRFGETQQYTAYQTTKINNTLARFITNNAGLKSWQIFRIPGMSLMGFCLPYEANYRPTMLVQDENTQGWAVLYDHPCDNILNHSGRLLAGTRDGRVVNAFEGSVDNLTLNTSEFKYINGRITPAYSQMDKPGLQKIANNIRLSMLGVRQPTLSVAVLSDYYLTNQSYSPVLPNYDSQFGVWDQDFWDALDALWAGGGVPLIIWVGVSASGFALTAQIDITGYGGLTLNQIDWMYTTGGPL